MFELPFKEWRVKSLVASVAPLLFQNLMLYFWIFANEPVALMVFFGMPVILVIVISGVIGYDSLKDTWGFDVPSIWHGLSLAGLGIAFGVATFMFATVMSTYVGFNLVPVPTATYLNQQLLSWTPELAEFWNQMIFNVLYFGVVAFGEELIVLFTMAGIANWIAHKGYASGGTAILIGAVIARILWAGTHCGAWLGLGLNVIGNFSFAIIVGMFFFTSIGFVLRSKEIWGNRAFAEFVIIGSLFAHWSYDIIVSMPQLLAWLI